MPLPLGTIPYERQLGESAKAFWKFSIYRDLDPSERSILKAENAHRMRAGKPPARHVTGHWKVASSRWAWVERAKLFDDDQDRRRRAEHQQQIRQMNERHVSIANAALGRVVEWLRKTTGEQISPAVAVQLLVAATSIQRRALGEPTEVVKQDTAVRFHPFDREFSAAVLASPEASRAADTLVAFLAGVES